MMSRLIDADSVKDFFFSETSGTEETIRDLAEKHNLTYLNDVNEDEVMSFAKDLLKTVQNVIETEPTAYDPDKIVEQLEYQKNIWNYNEIADTILVDEKRKAYTMAIKIVKSGRN